MTGVISGGAPYPQADGGNDCYSALMIIKPAGPIWWKVIVGSLLMLSQLANLGGKGRPVSNNYDQQQGANAMAVILFIGGGWLVYSGMKPVRNRKLN